MESGEAAMSSRDVVFVGLAIEDAARTRFCVAPPCELIVWRIAELCGTVEIITLWRIVCARILTIVFSF